MDLTFINSNDRYITMGCAKYNPIPQYTMHYSILLVNNMDVTEVKHVLSAVYNSEKKNESTDPTKHWVYGLCKVKV